MSGLSKAARVYVGAVITLAVVLVGWAATSLNYARNWTALIALVLLYVLSESITVRGDDGGAGINPGWIVGLASVALVGPWGAVLVAACSVVGRHGVPLIKRLFNSAQLSISAGVCGLAYVLVGGVPALSSSGDVVTGLIVPMLVADLVHCMANGLLVATVIALQTGVPVRRILQADMGRTTLSYLGYGLFGLLLAALWGGAGIGAFAAVLVLMPLYVARWAYAQYAEQQLAYDRTIRTLVQAVETKDLYTRGHSERVSKASVMIARRLGMREDRVNSLRYAGILHDVGKLGVPTRLLQKTGRLTEEEFSAIKMHPVRGLEMVREISFLDEAYAGIMHHHERLDGRGYPSGLAGGQIPEFARVIAVADAFDSMTTTRSYRGARSVDEAVEELQRCAGTQFDPTMVDALVTAIGDQGWQAETEPLFEPPAEPSAYRGYDHDDPTVEIAPAAETGRA